MEGPLNTMPKPADSLEPLRKVALRLMPRLLTQVCRDGTSPFHGCFDRNWWHYKIRDFPSIILQQGAYALHLAAGQDPWKADAASLNAVAKAACGFWNQRAGKHGAFEEYYPWEQGYPPLAFSTLAVMKLVQSGVASEAAVASGALVAAEQLKIRFESQAANQQVAGLAALAGIRTVFPEMVSEGEFERVSQKTMALQHEEGWFVEYEGPDLGYLTVTMDCLWDLFDFTGNPGYVEAAGKALRYISHFTDADPLGAGMHNARNTDYLVPYGIARFATTNSQHRALAARTFDRLYATADAPVHFFSAVDDRYISHYIGHSILRALAQPAPVNSEPEAESPSSILLEGSGHFIRKPAANHCGCIVSLRKGGIVSLFDRQVSRASDYGWIANREDRQFVTHWWSSQWKFSRTGPETFQVSGHFFPHKEQVSAPWKHAALRLASLLLGYRIIRLLKKMVIFKQQASPVRFERHITLTDHGAIIEDQVEGLDASATPTAAPRASKRHVASADSYQAEDLTLTRGFSCSREEQRNGTLLTLRSTFALSGQTR